MSKPPAGFERFAKFLAADITDRTVYDATGSETLWAESSAGHAFERDQNASIRGCYPGSFPVIDAYDEHFYTRRGVRRAVISLKVLYCFSDGAYDVAWENQVYNKVFGHLKELSFFRGGAGNLLPMDGSDRRRVEIGWDDFDIGVLRVGVPKSVFKSNKETFQKLQRNLTDFDLGGNQTLRMKPINGRAPKPLKTEIVAFLDDVFTESAGLDYETIKGAAVDGHRPGTFPTIDKIDRTKERVYSYKSIDLYKPSYDSAGGSRSINAVKGTLRGYIRALKDFRGASRVIGDVTLVVRDGDFTEKRLSVAIPMLTAGELDFYKAAFEELTDEAAAAHITLRFHRVA